MSPRSAEPGTVEQGALLRRLVITAAVLALLVVVFGAYVRISGAGLGCPDWPGCYGELTVPATPPDAAAWAGRALEPGKAWREMLHRYLAGALGVLIATAAALTFRRGPAGARPLAGGLLVLVVFQALLGMWTVTLLLKPVVVTAHLLGGMAVLGLLTAWALQSRGGRAASVPGALRPWALSMLAVVIVQIALGGWTSANYAAPYCPDFPTCQGQWLPAMDLRDAFVLWRGVGVDYEGGVLAADARVAIHVVHRIGAAVTLMIALALAWRVRSAPSRLRRLGLSIAALAAAQFALGVANVLTGLPTALAAGHNAMAALLLLAVVGFNHAVRTAPATAGPVGAAAPAGEARPS